MKSLRSAIVGITAASLLALPSAATAATSTSATTSAPFGSALTHGTQTLAAVTHALPVAGALAAGRYHTNVRFLNFDHVRRAGSTAKIRGQVVAKVGQRRGAVAGVRVTLHRKINGSDRWVRLDAGQTNHRERPSFTFRTRALANASYRVVFAGNPRLQRSQSVTGLAVHRAFNARLEDGTGRFHGRVVPRYSHRTIYLEKRACANCTWRRVDTAKTADRGRYSFKVGAPRNGRYYWRLQTPRSAKYVRSYSGTFTTERR